MNMKIRTGLVGIAVVLLNMTLAVPIVQAQDGALALEEIIVTARKREELLTDAPYAITAITADDLELKGIDEITDVVAFSPGFFYAESAVGRGNREHRRLVFRGLNPRTDLPHRAAATMFIDGASSLGAEFGAVENIERIEVLKGPQAAHFGRSTYAGAINVITKDPSDEFGGRISADVGDHGHLRLGGSVEGQLTDWLGARLTASTYEMDGMYDNAVVPGEKLGARSTDDLALTLMFKPSDKFDAKVRYHQWEDSDGPDATTLFDYRVGSGGEHHNCNLGSTWERVPTQQDLAATLARSFFGDVTITPTWICGQAPTPTAAQIGQDTGSLRANALRANLGDVELLPNSIMPNHFGLEREAEEVSLVANYNFENGMNLNFIAAQHEDFYGTVNDFDQRATEGLHLQGLGGSMFGTFGSNHPADAQNARINNLSDDSWEIRLTSSPDQKLRWMVGYSDTQIDWETQSFGSLIVTFPPDGIDNATAPFPVTYNPFWFFSSANVSTSNWNFDGSRGRVAFNDGITWADVTTTALFGSLAYDISDNLTASLELRRQEDDISEGNYAYERSGLNPVDGSSTIALPAGGRDSGTSNSGTFKSTLPRLILDWKPSEGKTIYASYSEGTRPGLFNSGLSDLSDGELAQIRTQTGGAGLQVDEEESENFELGIKTSFANGRGFLSASVYKTDISNLQTPVFAVSYTDDAGADQVISGSIVGQGATAKLSGLELEGVYLINEALKAEFTYAYNKSK